MGDYSPSVTVIVPAYNAGERLYVSIASLLAQSLRSIEIIIVNDASTDNTREVIDVLVEENPHIISVNFDENKGVHEARLAGLARASAPWVGFLDADDIARPNMFSVLYNVANENNVDIVVCGSERVTARGKIVGSKIRFPDNKKIDSTVFERFCRFEFGTGMLWNKLYRSEIIKVCLDMHFPWRQRINEDLLMNIRCFHRASSIYLCREMLHEYVFNPESVTSMSFNTRSYVDTFRAAALAIDMFSRLGLKEISNVLDLYREQLSWGGYCVDSSEMLMEFNDELKEAVDLINRSCPAALAMLSARTQSRPGLKAFLKFFYRSLLMGFGLVNRESRGNGN